MGVTFYYSAVVALLALAAPARAQMPVLPPDTLHVSEAALRAQLLADTVYARAHYHKQEFRIPMRDGARLHTVVYVPKDADRVRYPILLKRTPYSVGPYGPSKYKASISPSSAMLREGYIFALQDVRGRYMSEGVFEDVRPQRTNYAGKQDTDESTDAFDTMEYLLKKGPPNNGRLGLWGLSYDGFYTTAGLLSRHPALKAASPQAPVTDMFWDDDHQNGAYSLPMVGFWSAFGQPRPQPTAQRNERLQVPGNDGYAFYHRLGPLKNVNPQLFHGRVKHWNDLVAHPNYDAFWQVRNPRPHLKNIKTAVLTVGGFNDASDLFGTLHTYAAIEQQNPGLANRLVMGPWRHVGWSNGAGTGEMLGNVAYTPSPSLWYQQYVEAPFFKAYLKDASPTAAALLPEALVFEGGTNRWRTFDAWPPKAAQARTLYFQPGGKIGFEKPTAAPAGTGFDQFLSDPARPVPYTEATVPGKVAAYMTDDQRFASRRPDVLTYQSDVLAEDLTLAGPIQALLQVATTGTDADWVVKLIDVYPDNTPDDPRTAPGVHLGGYQQLVRAEVMRGRFRDSFSQPKPFVAGQVTAVPFTVQDLMHTFKKGHRLMVQVQSTWFPLFDRNPQQYVENIFEANESDFQAATHRLYFSPEHVSQLTVKVL
ncbi:X-Pro dipeptidyl-peptidase [Hymenobacter sedentarius]|uniref:X-Pro dipeptidyl-peptidase n=1 Tax=Hymenobacter sedentarius TaxID=1411621 RepID=A0A0U4BSL3_9BACT|nr:CocE/NonD family hydrolase [Hymenobacter sedentarius]ALW86682.1 X-Pro dipeptidyl-peptidase [Hymenobacter sedentarius]